MIFASAAQGSAILIGVFPGNVNETPASVLEVQTLAADPSITLYSKSDNASGPYAGSLMTLTGLPNGTSGMWSANNLSVLISYFAVKAGPEFALYKVQPPSNSGTWSTVELGNKELSHLTFYLADIPDDTDVPEPSTFGLLAGGGLAAWLLKRRVDLRPSN